MTKDASYWIQKLSLIPLPEEGGMYKETFRSNITIPEAGLPPGYNGSRVAITDIYYLLQGKTFSAFHRLRSDELWHFHTGTTLLVHIIYDNSHYECVHLGRSDNPKSVLRVTLPRGSWFAAEMKDKDDSCYALLSCVVAPGFELSDFEIGKREKLINQFPEYKEVITRLTHR